MNVDHMFQGAQQGRSNLLGCGPSQVLVFSQGRDAVHHVRCAERVLEAAVPLV